MRKSIVLLITLFFIATISILILQNLKDTDKFLDEISFDSSLSQVQITIDNIQQEVPNFLNKNKENIDVILENTEAIPLQFGNIDILLNIVDYTLPLFNINDINSTSITTITDERFINNVNYQYDFLELIKTHQPYKNNNQIQQTLKEYVTLTKDTDILKIKDEFTYLKDTNNSRYIQCNYLLKVDEIDVKVDFIFELNKKSIKEFNIVNIF